MALLGVNVDHVATIRQARRADEPDPLWAAVEAQLGGAACITFHLREDRRHIHDRDAQRLKEAVNVKLNMEMAIDPAIVDIAVGLQPTQCTLVPERREELTTEGGLDVVRLSPRVAEAVRRLRGAGIVCSAFVEPVIEQLAACAEMGFDAVELWTGEYAHARSEAQVEAAVARLAAAIAECRRLGLAAHGGHGLTYRNIARVASMPGFGEFNIGHSIVSRAVFVGMRRAVEQMVELLRLHAPAADPSRARPEAEDACLPPRPAAAGV